MGLDKIQKAKKVTEGYEKFFNLVEPFESVIGAELSSVPQVALPWAIVSASLDISSRRQGLLLLMTKISNRLSEFFSCSQSQRGQIRFYTLEWTRWYPEWTGTRLLQRIYWNQRISMTDIHWRKLGWSLKIELQVFMKRYSCIKSNALVAIIGISSGSSYLVFWISMTGVVIYRH